MSDVGYTQFQRTTQRQSAMRVNSNLAKITTQIMDIQRKLATGKSINRPSDDPFGTVIAVQLQAMLENKTQYGENVNIAEDFLSATDYTLGDVTDIITEARELGLSEVGATATDDTRSTAALVIESFIDDVVSKGNFSFQGRFLFAGTRTETMPFESAGTAVWFRGNNEPLYTSSDAQTDVEYSVSPAHVFATKTGAIDGFADLDPTINLNTDLRLLNEGRGMHAGSIVISDGTNTNTVDLSGVRTIGDVIDAINDGTPVTTTCTLNAAAGGLVITSTLGGADITVLEASTGSTAGDLGIYQPTPGAVGATLNGSDVEPVVGLTTPLSLLGMGAGIDQAGGIVIANGDYSATISLAGLTTVEQVLNAINGAGVYVDARLNDDRTGIDVISLLHGPELRISESTGTTARDLGIRSLYEDTALAELNDKDGVRTISGDDVRITCRNGDTIDVNMSNLVTVQDVIDAINNDAENAGRVTASMGATSNGIQLVDTTADLGVIFEVTALNSSSAANDLGILKSAGPGSDTIVGEDVNGVRNQSVFTHLMDLREALQRNDNFGILRSLERLDDDHRDILNTRAEAGTKGRRMQMLRERIDREIIDAKNLLSETQDLDFATTIVEYTTLQAAMEASLMTASTIVQLSLLDYMR